MVFWYTTDAKDKRIFKKDGDKWNGLAIVFDTYDNDRKGFEYSLENEF